MAQQTVVRTLMKSLCQEVCPFRIWGKPVVIERLRIQRDDEAMAQCDMFKCVGSNKVTCSRKLLKKLVTVELFHHLYSEHGSLQHKIRLLGLLEILLDKRIDQVKRSPSLRIGCMPELGVWSSFRTIPSMTQPRLTYLRSRVSK